MAMSMILDTSNAQKDMLAEAEKAAFYIYCKVVITSGEENYNLSKHCTSESQELVTVVYLGRRFMCTNQHNAGLRNLNEVKERHIGFLQS